MLGKLACLYTISLEVIFSAFLDGKIIIFDVETLGWRRFLNPASGTLMH